ncbi:unnamed protein product [Cyclocybe aegerita]|uniref:Uncharacterized protein n=1 Tax=Cyclocybe aegerita TaxID=1973307 RepID=A0A8S0WHL6_CYCAE|nr:unnamed protein product [Cyclocybe aegerita]
MQNQPPGILESVLKLKEEANRLYQKKSYTAALGVYSKILDNSGTEGNDDVKEFLRTVRSNRAAAHIALGHYAEAVEDLQHVLSSSSSGHNEGSKAPIGSPFATTTRKSYLRLARCFCELGKFDDATKHLDAHRDFVDGMRAPEEDELREKVYRDQQNAAIATEDKTVPLKYVVKIMQSTPTAPIRLYETVPLSLVDTGYPPETASNQFLAKLVMKHDAWLLKQGPLSGGAWKCWSCRKRATGIVHSFASFLNAYVDGKEPEVIDFAQPVCVYWGLCDREARRMMQEEMVLVINPGRRWQIN